MRITTPLSGDEYDALARLGETIRLARLRRNLSQVELAERIGVARSSVVALEKGRPGVAIGILMRALTVLGYPERLAELVGSDPIGDGLDLGRRRAGAKADVADF
ncbi:helix-turn-helix transcriptional regulator [Salinarimonas chemoclinalis]|uniref:helix-turn-helix transcriptional regulator n=1 Tax=Salinarimonas chemoclinalis TaxID=3241599 RepID=UPI0035565B1D